MRNPRMLGAACACFLFAVLALVCAQSVNGQASACDAPITSVYALQLNADASEAGVKAARRLTLESTRYAGAIGSPEYALYINEDQPLEQHQYWLAYADRGDWDNMILMRWSYERMFGDLVVIGTLPDGSPDYQHNHPDCESGTVRRADVEALLVDAVPRPTVAPILPPSAEAMERERLRLLRVQAEYACARVDAWYVNHPTSDGLAEAEAACAAATEAVLDA